MNFTNEQKLIVALLCEIHQGLKIEGDLDSALIADALWSDNTWALPWEYGFLLQQGETPTHVKHVVDTLDMWWFIELSYAQLTPEEKADFATVWEWEPKFPGFDGNEEGEYLSAARFLIDKLHRFTDFANRKDLNSHHPTVDRDRRMLERFEPMRKTLGDRDKRFLSVDDLKELFRR